MKRFLSIIAAASTFAVLAVAQSAWAGTATVTDPLAFGSVNVGESSNLSLTITRSTGNIGLDTPAATISGSSDFTIDTSACDGQSLTGGNPSCTMTVTFTPSTSGVINGTVNFVTTNGSTFTPTTTALSGTGVDAPFASVSPTSNDFGQVEIGQASSPVVVTVENTGTLDLVLGTLTLTGTDAGQYDIGANTCDGATIIPTGNCTVEVSFSPDAAGIFNDADLNIPTNTTAGTILVDLDGEGIAVAHASVNPTSLDFGTVFVSQTSNQLSITLSSTGTADLDNIVTSLLTGTEFTFDDSDCTANEPFSNGGQCTITVTFTHPAGIGVYSDTLTITSNAFESPIDVPLSGSVIADAPAVGLAPTSMVFANTVVGGTSSNIAVTLTNTGTAALNVTSVSLGGVDAAQFQLVSQNCVSASPIAPAGTCTIVGNFQPLANGSFAAQINIVSDAASSPDSIPLTGTGISVGLPAVTLNPTQINFGQVVNGTVSSVKQVTLTNTGSADLIIGQLTITPLVQGNGGAQFNIASDNCSNQLIAPQGQCVVGVTATVTANGAASANLDIPSNASTSVDEVLLTVTGVPPSAGSGGCSISTAATPSASMFLWALFALSSMAAVARIRRS
jgi:hypothetical protein